MSLDDIMPDDIKQELAKIDELQKQAPMSPANINSHRCSCGNVAFIIFGENQEFKCEDCFKIELEKISKQVDEDNNSKDDIHKDEDDIDIDILAKAKAKDEKVFFGV